MPSIQDLPWSIRRDIFVLVISARTKPPRYPRESLRRHDILADTGLWIQNKPPPNPALPLLLTNRAFHDEMKHLLASKSLQQSVVLDLDVMFVIRSGLWPTWTSLPMLARHIDKLQVEFRIFGLTGDSLTHVSDEFCTFLTREFGIKFDTAWTGSLPGMWNFFNIVGALLANGPLGLAGPSPYTYPPNSSLPCRYTIQDIVINVASPPDDPWFKRQHQSRSIGQFRQRKNFIYGPDAERMFNGPGDQAPAEYREWCGPSRVRERSLSHPADKLALYISNLLWYLLELRGCARRYGKLLYSGVLGTIEIRVDGTFRRRYDMERLRDQYLSLDEEEIIDVDW